MVGLGADDAFVRIACLILWLTLAIAPAFPATKTISGAKTSSGAKVVYIGAAAAPAKVTGMSPANGTGFIALDPTISWSAASGASAYDVWAGAAPGSLSKVSSAQIGLTYPVTNTAYSQIFYWRIDSKNGAGTTTGDVVTNTIVTPFAADAFVHLDSGNGSDEDLLTVSHLNTATHGSVGAWSFKGLANSDALFIDTDVAPPAMATPADVGGVYYTGGGGRSIRIDNSKQTNGALLTWTAPVDNVTLSMMIRYGNNNYGAGSYRGLDLVSIVGSGGSIFTVAQQKNVAGATVIVHTDAGGSTGITGDQDTWYCLEVCFSKTDLKGYVALYNPSTRAQIGTTQELTLGSAQSVYFVFGPTDSHVGAPTGFTYINSIAIKRGASKTFPLQF